MDRTANLLGALGLALYDTMTGAMAGTASGVGDVSVVDLAAMNAIGQQREVSVSFVARVTGLTHAGAVRVVNRLVAQQFVVRGPGPDGRTVAVSLTPKGRKLWRQQQLARSKQLESLLSGLDPKNRKLTDGLVETLLTLISGDGKDSERLCRLCDEASCPQDVCPVTLACTT
jgi:MarR family transcriptional regulator, negative regulator of the multidrug operon emrRAB